MPEQVVKIQNAEHYTWGQGCDSWHLLQTSALSIIAERMPPGTSETRHHHGSARQFFYVLEGQLTIEVDHQVFVVSQNEGLEIAPGKAHHVFNKSCGATRFLVISQPPSHGDRIDG